MDPNRLQEYDYSQNGAYFVTICTQDRKKILSGPLRWLMRFAGK